MRFFSVIIPLYNKENFIQDSLKSVLQQSHGNFEIIVVEDCSTDKSLEKATAVTDERIRIILHDHNKGLSASRNTGIRNAASELLCFLDADDQWKPDYLKKIDSLIENFPEAGLFATNYAEVYNKKVQVLPASSLKEFDNDGIVPDFFKANLFQHIYCCCSVCVRKDVFENIGFFDEDINYGEDIDFNIRANSEYKLAYSKEALVFVNVFSENQITNSELKGKKIVDPDKYEGIAAENSSLKKYLDVNRYILARLFRFEKDFENAEKMIRGIAPGNLNKKQKLLLKLPVQSVRIIRELKRFFVKKGIRLTSFQ